MTAIKCLRRNTSARNAFSLVELLVVLGVIALAIAMLLPTLAQARRDAVKVQCQANLRAVGQALKIYEAENDGWYFPVVNHPVTGAPQARGNWQPPHERWPMYVFNVPGAPLPPPYDPDVYDRGYDPVKWPVRPYTPDVLRCPTDEDPVEAHTYILNGHLTARGLKAGDRDFGSLTVSDVILAAEKYSLRRDYAIENDKAFTAVVDSYRHGPRLLSNYLFLDGHVASVDSSAGRRGLVPWTD